MTYEQLASGPAPIRLVTCQELALPPENAGATGPTKATPGALASSPLQASGRSAGDCRLFDAGCSSRRKPKAHCARPTPRGRSAVGVTIFRSQAINRGIDMPQSWEQARAQCQAALGELVEGRSEPFKALWSHADDVTIMGAFGGFERGWDNVAQRLDWASAGIDGSERRVENLLTVVGEDLACTVDLEHMERTRDGRTYHRVLRCTQVYRLEGETWKVIVRHADELPEKDQLQH